MKINIIIFTIAFVGMQLKTFNKALAESYRHSEYAGVNFFMQECKKVCSKCNQEKEINYFQINKHYTGGYTAQCKACTSDYNKTRYTKRTPRVFAFESIIDEIWKDIKGYEGKYFVSSFGRVMAKTAWGSRILKGTDDGDGYLKVSLVTRTFPKGSVAKSYSVHRLVAIAFIENPNNLPDINHKKGIKRDNRVTEIEWITQADNNRHAFETGLNPNKGEIHRWSILTENQVKEILTSDLSMVRLSEKFNVNYHTIHKVKTRKNWKHINV